MRRRVKQHGYKQEMRGIEAERIEKIIASYVHNPRDRKVLRLALLHEVSYTRISQRQDLEVSSRTVQTIMNRWMPVIRAHL